MKQFLESEISDLPPADCFFHVVPAPLEATVSYGGGTAKGPEAIIDASYQLEAFDGACCPCVQGIHTHECCETLEAIEAEVTKIWRAKQFPVVLGGEHTVTLGALRALKAAGEEFGVVQFDAHADLRDEYEGTQLSHACVMRRAIDDLELPLFQIGVRALSHEEHQLREERGICHLDAAVVAEQGIPERILPEEFPERIYLTFDVDAFDVSLMPSTGTPEPGGLSWREVMQALRTIFAEREVISADFVELAPIDGLHAYDYSVARLVYACMGFVERSRI